MSKNTRTRILLVAVASLLLVTMAVGGTLAWLTDNTDPVTNTFTTADVSIILKEHQLNADGKTVGTTEVDKNEGYKLVPGNTMAKDPFIRVEEGSELCWIFVEIVEKNDVDTYIDWNVNDDWTPMDVDGPHANDVDVTKSTVYYYKEAVDSTDNNIYILVGGDVCENGEITVDQDSVKVGETMTAAAASQLVFYGYAVQSANVADQDAAWEILYPTTNP